MDDQLDALLARLAVEFSAIDAIHFYATQSQAHTERAAAGVIKLFGHSEQTARLHGAAALARLGPEVASSHCDALLDLEISDGAHDEFNCILHALITARVVDDESGAARLLGMLHSESAHLRCAAIYLLTHRGHKSAAAHISAVAGVFALDDLNRGSHQPWSLAAYYLGRVGPLAVPHIDALISLLERGSGAARRSAAQTIGALRAHISVTQVKGIVALLACDVPAAHGGGALSPRRAALLAFTGLCRTPEEDPVAVSDDAATPGPGLPEAAEAAKALPSEVVACAPDVHALLTAEDEDTREVAARAASCLGAHADLAALIARLVQDESTDVVSAVADGLVSLHAYATVAAADQMLSKVLSDDLDAQAAASLCRVLGAWQAVTSPGELLASRGAAVGTTLGTLLASEEARVRAAAAAALGTLGTGASPSAALAQLGAVAELLQDPEAEVRQTAVAAVADLDLEAAYADELAELLGDRAAQVRNAASAVLKRERYC